jgi:hypothetical protein
VAKAMLESKIIDFELGRHGSDETVVRRLYSVELPFAFENRRAEFFEIVNRCSNTLGVSVFDVRVAGSAQTGYSFHSDRPFNPNLSDLDLAVVNRDYFEKLLRAAQKVALPNANSAERPRQNLFPTFKNVNVYHRFLENAAMYGFILPHYLPDCDTKRDIIRLSKQLSSAYSGMFKDVNIAFYISQFFFERKQQPNIGIYKSGRKGG